jgi:hypothetical protein
MFKFKSPNAMKTTKKRLLIFISFISLSMFLVSCGGSDDDEWLQKSEFVTNTDAFTLEGLASQSGAISSYTASFSGFLDDDILDNLISADFQNSDFGIGIFGLTGVSDSVQISNMKITINGTAYSVGSCYSDGSGDLTPDVIESSDSYSTLVKAYFNAMANSSSHEVTINVSFSTSENILADDEVTLRIKYYAKYYYKEYTE